MQWHLNELKEQKVHFYFKKTFTTGFLKNVFCTFGNAHVFKAKRRIKRGILFPLKTRLRT